jgi:hypothetical protein
MKRLGFFDRNGILPIKGRREDSQGNGRLAERVDKVVDSPARERRQRGEEKRSLTDY